MRTLSDSTFEEKVEVYRQRINHLDDLRGSVRSTFSSQEKAPHTREGSPERNSQSSYSRQLVSDYVAFGRDRAVQQSASESLVHGRRPGSGSFSVLSDQSSSFVQEPYTEKIARLESQLAEKAEALSAMAADQESMRRHLQESQSLLHSLERFKADAEGQLQEARREARDIEHRYQAIIRKLETSLQNDHSKLTGTDAFTTRDELVAKAAECQGLKKERLRLLKELERAKRKESSFSKKLRSEQFEKDRLKSQIKDLDLIVQVAEDRKVVKDAVESVKHENETLRKELRRKPDRTDSAHKRDVQLVTSQHTKGKTRTHSKHGHSNSLSTIIADSSAHHDQTHCCSKHRHTTQQLMDLLEVSSQAELRPAVQRLLTSGKHQRELIESLTDIVLQNSPPGSFPKRPSLSQIRKWVERLVEEYLALRTGPDQTLFADILAELRARLGVAHCREIPAAVDIVLEENKELRKRVGKSSLYQ